MKKIVVFLLLGFASFALLAGNSSHAADELVDLYPYGQEACSYNVDECTSSYKVGTSNWTMEYAGHRYHFVRGAARYAVDFEDADSDGYISAAEMGALSWNAFAGLTINDTDATVYLETGNARTDLTSVVHRKYSYFDETGALQMFEDHISTYYITNDGTEAAPDWRLATALEVDTFENSDDPAADIPGTIKTHIRMALDDVDTDGYVVEPLGYLSWAVAGYDPADPVEDWSSIINAVVVGDTTVFDGNPNTVVIPAGWTVVSWGTNDRGTANPLTTAYIEDMPGFMLDDTLTASFIYDDQPATFDGLTALDMDPVTAGVNIVVDVNSEYDLSNTITASWLDMFDEDGVIINSTEKIDYEVDIVEDGVVLETIDFTYDAVEDEYTASAEVTMIDTGAFGAGYLAVYRAETPEGDVAERSITIGVGVLPATFAGVEDRFIDQGTPVDLLEGITADDGYGVDITDHIEVSYPSSLNLYNPFPGEYQIDLEFTLEHDVAVDIPAVTYAGDEYLVEGEYNKVVTDFSTEVHLFTDVTNFKTSTFSWGSSGVIIEVAGDGTIIRTIDRHTWDLVDATNPYSSNPGSAQATFDTWLADLTLEAGGFVAVVGWKHEGYTAAKDLDFGATVTYRLDAPATYTYEITTDTSYVLTVDDMTAPILMVIDTHYSIYAGEYDNFNAAILANVVAYDFTDAQEDLALYVSDGGGLNLYIPDTYTVEVTVEDLAGHTAVVEFDIIVVENLTSDEDVEDLINDAIENDVITEQDVQDLIDGKTKTEAEIQDMIDTAVEDAIDALPADEVGTSLVVTIIISVVSAGLAFGGAFLLFGKK